MIRRLVTMLLCLAACGLVACGGGGDDEQDPADKAVNPPACGAASAACR